MNEPTPRLLLTPAGRKWATALFWASIAATLFQLAGTVLVDTSDFMLRGHKDATGFGFTIADVAPLLASDAAVRALGLVDYLLPITIYGGVMLFARALAAGVPFSAPVVSGARWFARSVLFVALAEIALNTVAGLVRVPGDTATGVALVITRSQIVFLLLGLTLVALAAILAEAKLAADDSASIV